MNTIGALIGIYVAFRLIKQGVQEIRKLEYSCNRCGSNTNDDISPDRDSLFNGWVL